MAKGQRGPSPGQHLFKQNYHVLKFELNNLNDLEFSIVTTEDRLFCFYGNNIEFYSDCNIFWNPSSIYIAFCHRNKYTLANMHHTIHSIYPHLC